MDENIYRTDGSIDTFENSFAGRDYEIAFFAHEFTSVCPMTGQPDFGEITLTYTPGDRCIELRSWKFYLQTFRSRGIFYENVTNRIFDDLMGALKPRRLKLAVAFTPRGGISTTVTVSHESATSNL